MLLVLCRYAFTVASLRMALQKSKHVASTLNKKDWLVIKLWWWVQIEVLIQFRQHNSLPHTNINFLSYSIYLPCPLQFSPDET